jgi:large subunit ribosomal protein L23
MKISNLINRIITTEKSVAMHEQNRYVLEVDLAARKGMIQDELKRIFNVDTLEIHTTILPGKKKRIAKSNRFGKTAKRKKAIVKLKAGQKIELLENKK